MAEHLHRLASGRHRSPWARAALVRARRIPHSTHVWVIGGPGWAESAPELLDPIVREERDPAYRIVIAGFDLTGIEAPLYGTAWNHWLRQSGMYRQRTRADAGHLAESVGPLLERLRGTYARTRGPPTCVLTRLGVPVAYSGC